MRLVLAVLVVVAGLGGAGARCRLHHLSLRTVLRSRTIVSATVTSLYMKQQGGASGGRVRVGRVFRGDPGLEGRTVVVQGFGSEAICLSNPRLGDTKLFFLKHGKTRRGASSSSSSGRALRFQLNDNILKINSRNLKLLTSLRHSSLLTKPRAAAVARSPACVAAGDARPECVRAPRAIKMMNDAKATTEAAVVTPATLPLRPPPPPPPCSFAPCEEGGTCEEHDGTFTCHCVRGRAGKYCELTAPRDSETAGFAGDSYVSVAPRVSSVTRTQLELSFRTFSSDGLLLLWLGATDWLAVAVVRGRLQVSYELGSGPAVLVAPLAVRLGEWHRLVFRRYHRDAQLQLDGGERVRGRARGRNKSLNIRDPVYIGGHPLANTSSLPGLHGIQGRGLQGCVREVQLMGRRPLSLMEDTASTRGHQLLPCGEHPCREGHCANLGQCEAVRPAASRGSRLAAVCKCGADWRGRRCLKKRKRKKKKHRRRHKHRQHRLSNETVDRDPWSREYDKYLKRIERRKRRGRQHRRS